MLMSLVFTPGGRHAVGPGKNAACRIAFIEAIFDELEEYQPGISLGSVTTKPSKPCQGEPNPASLAQARIDAACFAAQTPCKHV